MPDIFTGHLAPQEGKARSPIISGNYLLNTGVKVEDNSTPLLTSVDPLPAQE